MANLSNQTGVFYRIQLQIERIFGLKAGFTIVFPAREDDIRGAAERAKAFLMRQRMKAVFLNAL
jgi:hypothetical protein